MTDLDRAVAEYRAAIDRFARAAAGVPEAGWGEPIAAGKWTPGQNTEHVALSSEQATAIVSGTANVRGFPRLVRPLLRWAFLRRVLDHAKFPKGAKAPAPLSPAGDVLPRDAALARLRATAATFERAAGRATAATVIHPVFGRLALADYVLVNARHVTHHEAQLAPRA